jgi:hypothetical protein
VVTASDDGSVQVCCGGEEGAWLRAGASVDPAVRMVFLFCCGIVRKTVLGLGVDFEAVAIQILMALRG